MRAVFIFVLVLVLSMAAGPLAAADFKSGDFTVVSLPLSNDLYITGSKVLVTKPVAGDLLAAGGSIIVNGAVGADVMAAGGSVILNGPVGDDLRAAGGDITLAANVNGDVLLFGGSVTIPSGVVVKGDAIVGGGKVQIGGTIRGNLKVHAGTVDFSGVVQGNARFYADEQITLNGSVRGDTTFAAGRAVLGKDAGFGKNVVYWRQDGEMDFGEVPVTGQVRFAPELRRERHRGTGIGKDNVFRRGLAAAFGAFFFGTLLSGLLAIVLGVLLFKRTFREAGEVLHRTFWKGLGTGVLTYILLPVVAVIAMFTLIGLPVGLFLLLLFAFSLVFGKVIAATAFAAWMERRQVAHWGSGKLMLAAGGFFILLKLVGMVPFLGWVLVLLSVFAGYGALVAALLENRRHAV